METQICTLKDELVRAGEMLKREPDLNKDLAEALRLNEWYKTQCDKLQTKLRRLQEENEETLEHNLQLKRANAEMSILLKSQEQQRETSGLSGE